MISIDEAIALGYENKSLYQILVPKHKFEIQAVKNFIKKNFVNSKLDYVVNDEYFIFLQCNRVRDAKFEIKKLKNGISLIYQIF